IYRFQIYFLTSSCFAASFSSLTNVSTSVLCIMQARFISSVPKEGQSKQPFPKYFAKTAFVAGYFFVTSPVLIFFVMRISLPIISPRKGGVLLCHFNRRNIFYTHRQTHVFRKRVDIFFPVRLTLHTARRVSLAKVRMCYHLLPYFLNGHLAHIPKINRIKIARVNISYAV